MVFDVRFNFGSCVEAVIRNHRSRGTWGQEEHTIPYFPFVRNVPFEIIILSESTGFKVRSDDSYTDLYLYLSNKLVMIIIKTG